MKTGLHTVRKWPGKDRKEYPDARQTWQGVRFSHTHGVGVDTIGRGSPGDAYVFPGGMRS